MDTFLFLLALITFIFFVAFGIELALGNRTIKFLKDCPRLVSINPPKVSVIIPACNEEREIAKALQSILQQNYENLEIIVLNDRSTDLTKIILEQMAEQYPALRVIHITELPGRWLGKNHALYFGARQATGQLLLFTDADVMMKPDAISKAVNYLLNQRLDHLTCMPDLTVSGFALCAFIAAFGFFFSLYARPWRVKRPNRWHVGIGAFQLLRTDFYRSFNGHIPIAMRPDDDMKLGKLIKQNHGQQEMVWGEGLISVTWYHSLKELIAGLMKNAFAGLEYKFRFVILSSLALFVLSVFPFIAIFITSGKTFWLNLATILAIIIIFFDSARFLNLGRWYGFSFPLSTLLFIYIIWKSALTALIRGGIEWRGTRYSLKELRQNKL